MWKFEFLGSKIEIWVKIVFEWQNFDKKIKENSTSYKNFNWILEREQQEPHFGQVKIYKELRQYFVPTKLWFSGVFIKVVYVSEGRGVREVIDVAKLLCTKFDLSQILKSFFFSNSHLKCSQFDFLDLPTSILSKSPIFLRSIKFKFNAQLTSNALSKKKLLISPYIRYMQFLFCFSIIFVAVLCCCCCLFVIIIYFLCCCNNMYFFHSFIFVWFFAFWRSF